MALLTAGSVPFTQDRGCDKRRAAPHSASLTCYWKRNNLVAELRIRQTCVRLSGFVRAVASLLRCFLWAPSQLDTMKHLRPSLEMFRVTFQVVFVNKNLPENTTADLLRHRRGQRAGHSSVLRRCVEVWFSGCSSFCCHPVYWSGLELLEEVRGHGSVTAAGKARISCSNQRFSLRPWQT